MPRLTKIYTRGGDDGTTGLGTGRRVRKDDLRVEAYGAVDELNSCIGLAIASCLHPDSARALAAVQNELFHLGSDLAVPADDPAARPGPRVEQRHIDELEALLDRLTAELGPLENFILPGGTPGAAGLHLARTTCRRAERVLVALAAREPVSPVAIQYLNRLSDALFVLARYENHWRGVSDVYWNSRI